MKGLLRSVRPCQVRVRVRDGINVRRAVLSFKIILLGALVCPLFSQCHNHMHSLIIQHCPSPDAHLSCKPQHSSRQTTAPTPYMYSSGCTYSSRCTYILQQQAFYSNRHPTAAPTSYIRCTFCGSEAIGPQATPSGSSPLNHLSKSHDRFRGDLLS